MHTLEVPNNSAFIKTSTAVIGGAVMTFAAFAFMQYLISGEQRALIKPGGDIIVEIFQAPEDKQTTTIKRIPPPPMPKVPPKAPPRSFTQCRSNYGNKHCPTINNGQLWR